MMAENCICFAHQCIIHTFRVGNLLWYDGMIPDFEIWLRFGGDRGGGSFKMNFQIVNTKAPHSVLQHVSSHVLRPVTSLQICI